MMHKSFYLVAVCLLGLLLGSCEKDERDFYSGSGKKPVYLPVSELLNIGNEAPKSIQLSGTIFLKDTLLFVLEQKKGVHVYDISDSLNTVNLAFFKIPAITDFVISGHLLYADSWRDLVVIDISNLQQIKEVNRITGIINPPLYPPLYDGIFECVDESKGAVVDWEDAYVENVNCRTIN